MAGVVTAVCFSLNYIIIYWTFYKKMPIRARPYLSVSITQRWGVENLPLSSHALASFRGSLGFQCTTILLAQQKKNPHLRGMHNKKKIPIWGGLYSPLNFVAQFLSALSLCGIVIYIIVVVVVVMVFLGWPLMNPFPCSKYTVGMLSMYAIYALFTCTS